MSWPTMMDRFVLSEHPFHPWTIPTIKKLRDAIATVTSNARIDPVWQTMTIASELHRGTANGQLPQLPQTVPRTAGLIRIDECQYGCRGLHGNLGRMELECIYTYIYIYTHMYIYICVCVCVYIYICAHTHIYIYIYRERERVSVCVCVGVCIYTHWNILESFIVKRHGPELDIKELWWLGAILIWSSTWAGQILDEFSTGIRKKSAQKAFKNVAAFGDVNSDWKYTDVMGQVTKQAHVQIPARRITSRITMHITCHGFSSTNFYLCWRIDM